MEMHGKIFERTALTSRRLFPAAMLLCMCLPVPLEAYCATEPMPETVQQNTVRVKGVVKDEKGIPVIGANVTVEGTTTGCVTDLDGKFALNVPVGGKTKNQFHRL